MSQKAAIFWWNLHRNGEGNDDTLHAGCPVLIGDKWGKTQVHYDVTGLWKSSVNMESSKSVAIAYPAFSSPDMLVHICTPLGI